MGRCLGGYVSHVLVWVVSTLPHVILGLLCEGVPILLYVGGVGLYHVLAPSALMRCPPSAFPTLLWVFCTV